MGARGAEQARHGLEQAGTEFERSTQQRSYHGSTL